MIEAGIIQGIIAFCGFGALLLVLLRAFHKVEAIFVVLLAALLVYPVSLAGFVGLAHPVNFWVFSTSYWFFVLSFLMGFGAIYKSLSLRMLLTLLETPTHEHSAESFRKEYIFGDSFNNRLQLMVDQGLAEQTDDGLSLTVRGANWANRLVTLQRAFGIMRSG